MFKTHGILGQNARNLEYIKWYNTKFARNLADSKLKTKHFLQAKKVAVPKTIAVIETPQQINISQIADWKAPFVIKPNSGYGWKWIIVIDTADAAGNFISNTGKVYSPQDIVHHLNYVIDGFFSISWGRDKAMIEKKIVLNEEIELLWKFGLPDIRIIVFNNVPIMAMLRVPTARSDGKANLHLGACGVGIDIWSGKLTYITQDSKITKAIPDIWDVRGIKIPLWNDILTLAVKVQYVTGVWYLWCDIVLDKDDGPLLLEMNVRAGLEVQIANMAPLKQRLDRVEGVNINSPEKWVRLGRDLFSWDIEEKIKNISWKKVLWAREYISLEHNGKTFKYIADIEISRSSNSLDTQFAKEILQISEQQIQSGKIRLKSTLLGEVKYITYKFKSLKEGRMTLGFTVLKGFLIDPFKYRKWELPVSDDNDALKWKNTAIHKRYWDQLLRLDHDLMTLDKQLIILSNITPNNLWEQKQKFIESKGRHIPQFEYNDMRPDLVALGDALAAIEIPDIPLSSIYARKKDEIQDKITFLTACQQQDIKTMRSSSTRLFGVINDDNLRYCADILSTKPEILWEDEYLSFSEMSDMVNKFNHIYGIKIRLQVWDRAARFVMKGETLLVRPDAKVWKKEMRSIIAHEIEGHYLRKVNGKKMPYSMFARWSAGYIEIDEGIAIYNQNRFLTSKDKKYYGVFERYYFVHYALNHSYKTLIEKMLEYYENDYERVFNYLVRLKRWVKDASSNYVFPKDVIYVNGYLKVDDFLNTWWDLKDLYLGKMTIQDIQDLKDSYFLKLNFNDLRLPFFL